MKTESNKQIAERIAQIALTGHVWTANQLIDAIEAALDARDEQAGRIAQEHGPCQDGCYCAADIAEKIRGKD